MNRELILWWLVVNLVLEIEKGEGLLGRGMSVRVLERKLCQKNLVAEFWYGIF